LECAGKRSGDGAWIGNCVRTSAEAGYLLDLSYQGGRLIHTSLQRGDLSRFATLTVSTVCPKPLKRLTHFSPFLSPRWSEVWIRGVLICARGAVVLQFNSHW